MINVQKWPGTLSKYLYSATATATSDPTDADETSNPMAAFCIVGGVLGTPYDRSIPDESTLQPDWQEWHLNTVHRTTLYLVNIYEKKQPPAKQDSTGS
jgi:hypothetical protein